MSTTTSMAAESAAAEAQAGTAPSETGTSAADATRTSEAAEAAGDPIPVMAQETAQVAVG